MAEQHAVHAGGIEPSRCHDPYLRCALYGAAQTALGIRGCCVLSHSPQGCHQLVGTAFGWQDADYTETVTLCTKLCEDEIVHGGEQVLARTILEADELDVPVMFVLTACGPEIVGDDIVAVCDEIRSEAACQLVPIPCAGFRGDQNHGIDLALEAMLRYVAATDGPQTDTDTADPRPSVCLIAPHANANPTWMADLDWAKEALVRLGARVAAVLSHDTLLGDLWQAPLADACIVLSHDAGQKAADLLVDEHGVEQWCRELPLPIGFTHTRNWLLQLGDRLGMAREARAMVNEGEAMVVRTCRRKGLQQSAMHRAPAAIVADATIGIPMVRFVTEDLEMIPRLVCLRSGQESAAAMLQRELDELGLAAKVIHDADVYRAKMGLAESTPEMVVGSNIEQHAVAELDIPYVFRLVSPISRYRMIDRAYWGYTGMLNLIECMQNDWRDRYRSKHRRYRARW